MKTFKILIILINLYLIVECNVIQLTNFEVNPGKFQGDIILTEDQENAIFAETQNKTGLINLNARWLKDSKGMVNVPYIFDTVYNDAEKTKIKNALAVIEKNTCIRFPMRTYQKDYVKIISDTGCYSFLGRLGGEQRLSLLKNGCLYVGIIQHEFIHALGYAHMHSHADRDAYISINYSNVPGGEGNGNFRKVDPKFFSNFNTPYDYLSVMHYGTYAFAINNSIKVITTKDSKFQNLIGQRNGPSLDDFRRLNRMYACKGVVLI